MPIVLASGRELIAAYNGDPSLGLILGHAKLQPGGVWTVQVGGLLRRRRRRRAAIRTLHRLAVARLTARTLARAPIARREAVGGGVLEYRSGGAR